MVWENQLNVSLVLLHSGRCHWDVKGLQLLCQGQKLRAGLDWLLCPYLHTLAQRGALPVPKRTPVSSYPHNINPTVGNHCESIWFNLTSSPRVYTAISTASSWVVITNPEFYLFSIYHEKHQGKGLTECFTLTTVPNFLCICLNLSIIR